jgi:hypothetical protein
MCVWETLLGYIIAKITKFSHSRIPKSDQSPVTLPTDITAQCAFPHATPTDGPSEGLQMGECSTTLHGAFNGPQGLIMSFVQTSTKAADCCNVGWATMSIDKLTDDALLDIFDFYLNMKQLISLPRNADEWHTLAHVCQRWRNIVFASPHRLNLRLLCTSHRSVRAALDIWPELPLMIDYVLEGTWDKTWEVQDNVIAALEHHDRVRQIFLTLYDVPNPVSRILAAAMQVPFPELTSLTLWAEDESGPVLPDSFLGGSAPRLQTLSLRRIPFPGVWNLPLSASDLVDLDLLRLPHSGYISPASMVACLSSLNRLESFKLGFESPRSRPDQPSPPPLTRVVLPTLNQLTFIGMSDYSEDFLARIDTPILNILYMEFFMDLVFDVPHFKQFIGRANGLNQYKAANLLFYSQFILLLIDQPSGLLLRIRCNINRIDWQLDSMGRVCDQLSPFFSSIERFNLVWNDKPSEPQGKDDMESAQFLEIFQPFTAIRSLYVSKTLFPFIAAALQEPVGESVTEVLPNLCDLSLEEFAISRSTQQDIQPFIEARRLAGRPVAVHHWDGNIF